MKEIKTMHREKQYKIEPHEKGGWIVTRLDTGSTCKVSMSLVNRTRARLLKGEAIPFRSISYTVAIETAVIAIIGCKVDKTTKTYTSH
jgi:hypothetical protein